MDRALRTDRRRSHSWDDVLVFDVAARIRAVARLKGLHDVFGETLHQLSEMGVAGSGTGGVTV